MRRARLAAAGLIVLTALGACQTWQDKADAAMLADCAKIADPEAREACQTEVMTAYGDAERAQKERYRQAAKASEEREALRKAYGIPDDAH
jgi:hypothetical protein